MEGGGHRQDGSSRRQGTDKLCDLWWVISPLGLARSSFMQAVFAIFSPPPSPPCCYCYSYYQQQQLSVCLLSSQNQLQLLKLLTRSVSKCQTKLHAILPVPCNIFIQAQIKTEITRVKLLQPFKIYQRPWTQRMPPSQVFLSHKTLPGARWLV